MCSLNPIIQWWNSFLSHKINCWGRWNAKREAGRLSLTKRLTAVTPSQFSQPISDLHPFSVFLSSNVIIPGELWRVELAIRQMKGNVKYGNWKPILIFSIFLSHSLTLPPPPLSPFSSSLDTVGSKLYCLKLDFNLTQLRNSPRSHDLTCGYTYM